MIKKIIIVILSALFCICCIAYTINNEPEEVTFKKEIAEVKAIDQSKYIDLKTYQQELETIASSLDVVGMQVVVFKDNEIINSFNYGLSDKENNIEVNDDTVFRIASVSKMISNILIMKLIDEDKITLDTNLKKATGLNFKNDVLLKHVLTHTSGMKDSSEFNDNMDKVLDINYLLNKSNTNYKAGEKYIYSNFMAGTMSAIVEKITGERFYDYALNNLFKPLGLNAAYLVEDLKEGTRVAKMYQEGVTYDPNTWLYNKDFYSSFELGKQYRLSYGNLYISASDLAKIGMLLAGDGSLNGTTIISKDRINDIREVYYKNAMNHYDMCLNTDKFINLVEGKDLYGHNGQAYNSVNALIYEPSTRSGVAIVSNHASTAKTSDGYYQLVYNVVNLVHKEILK